MPRYENDIAREEKRRNRACDYKGKKQAKAEFTLLAAYGATPTGTNTDHSSVRHVPMCHLGRKREK